MICAHSNTGVDNLANRLKDLGLNVTKIVSHLVMDKDIGEDSNSIFAKIQNKFKSLLEDPYGSDQDVRVPTIDKIYMDLLNALQKKKGHKDVVLKYAR